MNIQEIRDDLMIYITDIDADEAMLKALHTLLNLDRKEGKGRGALTEEQWSVVREEQEIYESGKGKSYTTEEAGEIIKGKKPL